MSKTYNDRKISKSDGSIFLSANTVKPYVAIKMKSNGFLVQGCDTLYDQPSVLFAPKVNGAQRVRLPEIMLRYYPELIGAHKTTIQHEGVFFECSMASEYRNIPFRLPEGCSYSDTAMPNIEPWVYEECEMDEVKRGSYEIHLVHSAKKTYILLEPHENTKPLMSEIYGSNFAMFMGGVVSYTTKIVGGKPLKSVPKKFLDLAGFNEVSVRKCGTSYLITPNKEDCFFDGAKIDAAKNSGKRVALCEACASDNGVEFVKAIKKVFEEYNRLKTIHDTLTSKSVILEDKKDFLFPINVTTVIEGEKEYSIRDIRHEIGDAKAFVSESEEALRKIILEVKELKKKVESISSSDYMFDGTYVHVI